MSSESGVLGGLDAEAIASRRWLITGADGQLGSDLQAVLGAAGAVYLPTDRPQLDILDSVAVAAAVADYAPDVLLNAAAYTAVDAAETDEDTAYAINARGPAVLASALATRGGRMIHVSTDYVFAGDATSPYEVDDEPSPRSAYGRTKLAGELAVRELLPDASFVVRTAWVYGAAGANFVKTMARLEKTNETVSVVDDQLGSPTWSADLARGLVEVGIGDIAPGTYHCTGTGEASWYEFAQAIFAELDADPARVLPTTSAAFVRPAPRPAYSVLSPKAWEAAGLRPMPQWRDALSRAFALHALAFKAAS